MVVQKMSSSHFYVGFNICVSDLICNAKLWVHVPWVRLLGEYCCLLNHTALTVVKTKQKMYLAAMH